MKLLVVVGGLVLVAALASASNVKNIQTTENSCQCIEVPGSICAGHFGVDNWYAQFPNARNLDLTGSIGEFFHFYPFLQLDNYCSHMLFNLLCFHYFPQCSLERPHLAATPCRETCTEAVEACLPHAEPGYQFPEHLNCSNFQAGEIECGESSGEPDVVTCNSQCTACPKARIHLEFALPVGKTEFKGNESDGFVHVCLRLANVGSYNSSDTLKEEVTVVLRPKADSAEAGSDFVQQNTTVVFPVGSPKGQIECGCIAIVDDNLNEEEETIVVCADVVAPSTALFGGELAGSSGKTTAKICDDEEDVIVQVLPTQAEVTEGDGFVQLGLRLVDIGSRDTLNQEVRVTFCPLAVSAEATTDFVDNCLTIVCPVGSRTGDTAYVNITIVDDKLKEDREIFVVLATISSSNAAFGGGAGSSANITVTITDDDDHAVPENECGKKCNWRTGINRKTFNKNPYTYAARIRVIECGDSVLDVIIEECFSIQCGVCPPDGIKYSIPYCPICSSEFDPCPIGKEYIVAGKNSSDFLYIGNTKQSGLVTENQRLLNTIPVCQE